MSYKNCVLIRNSYDCSLSEQDKTIFKGKLTKANYLLNEYSYTFKVEDNLMKMNLKYQNGCIEIIQEFVSGTSYMRLEMNKTHTYSLKLKSGHSLEFDIKTTQLDFKPNDINVKYSLIDKNKGDIISLNEINIKEGE